MKCCACLICGLLLFPALNAAPHLRDVLTPEQFQAFGLDKLSEEELQALSDWYEGKGSSTEGVVAAPTETGSPVQTASPVEEAEQAPVVDRQPADPVASFGAEQVVRKEPETKKSPDEITSVALGEFDGWKGYTVFKLENGQVWRQTDGERFFVGQVRNPTVVISKGFLGTYYLRFEGYNSRCKVKRER